MADVLVVLWGGLIAVFGPLIPFVIIQAVFGGLQPVRGRQLPRSLPTDCYGQSANGRERCTVLLELRPIVANLFLYHLQQHSDHHANPTRRAIRHCRSMALPNLPSGYASMISLTCSRRCGAR